jgi:hypothetical protein
MGRRAQRPGRYGRHHRRAVGCAGSEGSRPQDIRRIPPDCHFEGAPRRTRSGDTPCARLRNLLSACWWPVARPGTGPVQALERPHVWSGLPRPPSREPKVDSSALQPVARTAGGGVGGPRNDRSRRFHITGRSRQQKPWGRLPFTETGPTVVSDEILRSRAGGCAGAGFRGALPQEVNFLADSRRQCAGQTSAPSGSGVP